MSETSEHRGVGSGDRRPTVPCARRPSCRSARTRRRAQCRPGRPALKDGGGPNSCAASFQARSYEEGRLGTQVPLRAVLKKMPLRRRFFVGLLSL
jgi:hypothetical protein